MFLFILFCRNEGRFDMVSGPPVNPFLFLMGKCAKRRGKYLYSPTPGVFLLENKGPRVVNSIQGAAQFFNGFRHIFPSNFRRNACLPCFGKQNKADGSGPELFV